MNRQLTTYLAGVLGSGLEWYDFTIYAFMAPFLATLFFPTHSHTASLLLVFSVFALGFIIRPVGGLFFGYMGDHVGRRKALIISLILMSTSTVVLGLLPTYATLGLLAPILLTLLRLLQGLAVSGEMPTAVAFLVEHAQQKRRGIAGSMIMCSAFIGIVIGSAFATLITEFMKPEALLAWGWRIPFILGGIMGILCLILRLRAAETAAYEELARILPAHSHPSLFKHIKSAGYKPILLGCFLTSVMAVGNYFFIGYFNSFLIKIEGLPANEVMLINFFSLAIFTILLPIMGRISDSVGRLPVLKSGIIGFLILSYPIFWLLTQHSIPKALIAELLFGLALAPVTALIPTTLAELFSAQVRNSGIAAGYNISLTIFGGTAPLIALALVSFTDNNYAPAWYLMGCALISWLALTQLQDNYQRELIVDPIQKI